MTEWEKMLVAPGTSIRETIRIMEQGSLKIALVVNEERRLLGTVVDGDVRRGILKGCLLDGAVREVMTSSPTVASPKDGRDTILSLMRQKQVRQVPVVDEHGVLVGLEVLDVLSALPKWDNPVVLMAGGLGTRLSPLTVDLPKPLLKIGNKPILEKILDNFVVQGFNRFFISVNYKSDLIEAHFGDGSQWGVTIEYLREEKKLGTAGALGLLPPQKESPVLVMNGDVLTKVDFKQLLDFHQEHKAVATMCVREYDFQVPYGVVKLDQHRIASIEEKPVQRVFVNAGMYVLEPEVLGLVPCGSYFDMPSLFQKLVDQQKETAVFPVREYWIDIGRHDDFVRAQSEYTKVFE